MKIENFEIPGKSRVFSKFEKFQFSLTFPKIFFFDFFDLENYFSIFSSRKFSHQEKFIFFEKIFSNPKIYPGIRKSYLENRTIILKMFKIQNPKKSTQNRGFW